VPGGIGSDILDNQPLATPEPAALLLTGVGLLVIGKLRWGRRPKVQMEDF
jgi:hypothetical protein